MALKSVVLTCSHANLGAEMVISQVALTAGGATGKIDPAEATAYTILAASTLGRK
jgi:hypothetical protein